MKFLTIALCIALLSHDIIAQTCLPNGIGFSQESIDNFSINYPGCTQILGSVTIEGGYITNLNGLSALTSIGGNLNVYDTDSLTSLMGLSALTTIEGQLYISNNAALTSLTGLDALTNIGGYIEIYNNDALTNLTGLSVLNSTGGYLRIYNNETLTSLTGLDALSSIEGFLEIYDNPSLMSLAALSSLSSIGGSLTLENNSALTSLMGLNALISIGGSLQIYDNSALTSLTALSALTSIEGYLNIQNNSALTSLMGLENIDHTTITSLNLKNSGMLYLCEVKSICDYLAIPSNLAYIFGNATGCAAREQVEAACLAAPTIDIEHDEVNVFPNPTTGIIEIQSTNTDEGTIRLMDNMGRLIKVLDFPDTKQMDLNKQPNGMYFIEILTDRRLTLKRIVKE
jgi:acyl-[acyl carrier protein]--UDP-N-acetylglucosamine O-acyltransferase